MKFVLSCGIVDCLIAVLLLSDCVLACVHGQCNTSLGMCQCSDGYTGVDCNSNIGRYVAIITFHQLNMCSGSSHTVYYFSHLTFLCMYRRRHGL